MLLTEAGSSSRIENRAGASYQRIGPTAQRAVELVEQGRAEALRETASRKSKQVGQATKAGRVEQFEAFLCRFEQYDRQFAQASGQFAWIQAAAAVAPSRQQPGSTGVGCPAKRGTEAGCDEFLAYPAQQRAMTAEVTQAGLHFEQQARGSRVQASR
ncbi:MAG TPA: hypothetical protein PK177_11685 [Burkholderiaceae bacterium]|nr:hypothetical protein [Burkholderiaceae bacterium]